MNKSVNYLVKQYEIYLLVFYLFYFFFIAHSPRVGERDANRGEGKEMGKGRKWRRVRDGTIYGTVKGF